MFLCHRITYFSAIKYHNDWKPAHYRCVEVNAFIEWSLEVCLKFNMQGAQSSLFAKPTTGARVSRDSTAHLGRMDLCSDYGLR